MTITFAAIQGIELFGFHANVNKEIDSTEPGDIVGDVTVNPKTQATVIAYEDQEVRLKVGDVVHYWVYVQYNYLGYRKEGQKWQVTGNMLNIFQMYIT